MNRTIVLLLIMVFVISSTLILLVISEPVNASQNGGQTITSILKSMNDVQTIHITDMIPDNSVDDDILEQKRQELTHMYASNFDETVIGDNSKFDHGFYDRVQCLINLQDSEESIRYYNIIIIVEDDDSKQYIVDKLNELGAYNITKANSLSFITADIPIHKIPILSQYNEIQQIGDGELPVTVTDETTQDLDVKRDTCDILLHIES